MKTYKILSGNALKVIAVITMLIDHIGHILLPQMFLLRKIGRLSLPIFAFMIAEGCIYTKNKLRYFLGIFLLAVLCQVGYFIAGYGLDLSILVTFSYSILIIYALQNFRKQLNGGRWYEMIFAFGLFVFTVGMTYIINRYYRADYGFWGCMLPLFAYLPVFIKEDASVSTKVVSFAVGVFVLAWRMNMVQYYSLLSLPLLMMYSGKRGKYNIKYIFYVFYPLHLVILHVIHMCIQ